MVAQGEVETVVSQTMRSDIFRSEVVRVTGGRRGEYFYARVVFKGIVAKKSEPIFDQDAAEMEADVLREEVFRDKFSLKK